MNYKLRFFRYFRNGSLDYTYEIPTAFTDKHTGSTTNSTTRFKVKELLANQTPAILKGHMLENLFTDQEFVKSLDVLYRSDRAPGQLYKSFRKPKTNFYVSFINPDQTSKIRLSTQKKEKTPKIKKDIISSEAENVFKSEKQKALKKIEFIQKLRNFPDCTKIHSLNKKENEVEKKNLKDIFGAWTMAVENTLTAMQIPFIIYEEGEHIPSRNLNLSTSYLLVENTENFPKKIISKLDPPAGLFTITWYATNHKTDPTYRRSMEKCLITKKIGISSFLGRSFIKGLKTLRFSSFKEIVEKLTVSHKENYEKNITNMKEQAQREPNNKINLDKLKKYLTEEIMPLVDRKYIFMAPGLELENDNFSIKVEGAQWRNNFTILRVDIQTDSAENVLYNLHFFEGKKTFQTADVDKVIMVLNDHKTNLVTMLNTYATIVGL